MFTKLKQNGVYLLDIFFLVIILILPGNSYQWMQNLGISSDELPVDNNFSFRAGFTFLLLILLVAIHCWCIFRTQVTNLQRNTHMAFIALVCLVWAFKFFV